MKGLKGSVLIIGLIFGLLAAVSQGRIEPVRAPKRPVTIQSATNHVTALIKESITRAIQTAPFEYEEAVAHYFRQVGNAFCNMAVSGDFTHAGISKAADDIPSPMIVDGYALDVKIMVLALYKVIYGDRLRSEIPPDRWLAQMSQVFCEAINAGLKDAGQTGSK